MYKAETEVGGMKISIETGRIAKQAGGSVIVTSGDTVVICTATAANEPKTDLDFFPLTCDYRERAYAAGKIPGGFFKRESRPGDKETLTARMTDRPIRPLFPKSFRNPTHVVSFVLSHDQKSSPDLLSILGSSAALMISDIPFEGPVSPIRIGRINGEFMINPLLPELAQSELNLTVVCSETSIVMVEGSCQELPEALITEALELAFKEAQHLNRLQRKISEACGKPKREVPTQEIVWLDKDGQEFDPSAVFEDFKGKILDAIQSTDKLEIYRRLDLLRTELLNHFEETSMKKVVSSKFSEIEREVARDLILSENRRNDSRSLDEVRSIECEVGLLPCTHGSGLFTRGQTQALVSLTLGSADDEQKIDNIEGESYKSFMLHYNFPPFSVGEAGMLRGPGRREVGHGNLAERSLIPVIPKEEEFPYTIRIVSDIMESNGSSSMASVCGATLSLLDGGVPIRKPVAGIAMGLVLEGDKYAILSDISGLEDHLGDMDFKVAGTEEGITAIQMDIKLKGFSFDILTQALEQARQGRLHILNIMKQTIAEPRHELKPHAPKIHIMKINPEKIGVVVGPGGKMIRSIVAETGAKIAIEDDGTVKVSCSEQKGLDSAIHRVQSLVEEAVIGKDYSGIVRRVEGYGAFIEILPNTEGLLHISQMATYRVREVEDEMNLGDEVLVRVLEIDRMGKVKLTRKELMAEGKVPENPPSESDLRERPRENRDDRNRSRSGGRRPFNSRDSRDSNRGDSRGSRPSRNRYDNR